MALRARDIPERVHPAVLSLVEPPRKDGHPRAALAFVVTLIAVLTAPVAREWLTPPVQISWEPRPRAAAEIEHIDPLPPQPKSGWPRSSEPVGGLAFVRCTHLWTAHPDGSGQRKLLELSGISAPVFSPDARTIAFLRQVGASQELWLASADGREKKRIGPLAVYGDEPGAWATNLAWSPRGDRLLFALSDTHDGEWTGGSAVFELGLRSGTFKPLGGGWPAPFWYGTRATVARWTPDGSAFSNLNGSGPRGWTRTDRGVSVLGGALAPADVGSSHRRRAIVIHQDADGIELGVRSLNSQRDRALIEPPYGYRISPYSQPTISTDSSRAVVDLIDYEGDRDLGILDLDTSRWVILDHAWEAISSPAPVVDGPLRAQRAVLAVEELLMEGRHSFKARLLGTKPVPHRFPYRAKGFTRSEPHRTDDGWFMRTTVYGRAAGHYYSFRSFDIELELDDGRMSATAHPTSTVMGIRTIDDAVLFARAALGDWVPAPVGLPRGTELVPRYGLQANSWATMGTVVQFAVELPGKGREWDRQATYYFGPGVMFMDGCGDGHSGEPEQVDIAGTPGVLDDMSGTAQVIWPATLDDQDGALFSVSGSLATDEILRLARAMAASRPN